MNKWMNKIFLLTIEKEKGDELMGSGKSTEKKGQWSWKKFMLFGKRIPRKFYLTFGSEQEISVVFFWLE